jgi:hypothetical protein
LVGLPLFWDSPFFFLRLGDRVPVRFLNRTAAPPGADLLSSVYEKTFSSWKSGAPGSGQVIFSQGAGPYRRGSYVAII